MYFFTIAVSQNEGGFTILQSLYFILCMEITFYKIKNMRVELTNVARQT